MLPEISGEITPERMKRQTKAKQYPVVDVTDDRSKVTQLASVEKNIYTV